MSPIVLYTIISLTAVGILSAVILYLTARKFHVSEDQRVIDVESELPGVNCGGCGYPGCHHFAEELVKAVDISTLYCPVGGNDCMGRVAVVLGKEVSVKTPLVAVVRCSGSPEFRLKTNIYDGTKTCAIVHNLYIGESGCAYGCFGLGDCVPVCKFDAIYIDKNTELPVVIAENCTACGACVKACPREIIELRNKGLENRRIFVSCVNKDTGAVSVKNCKVACIGCGKCVKECPFDAITLKNNLAYIDFEKCKLCRKCVVVCPTHAILEINFPPRKQVEQKTGDNESNENTS